MSRRTERVGELVRRTLAEILGSEFVRDPRISGVTLSVTAVQVTGDLSIASVYVDLFGDAPKQRVLSGLRASAPRLRAELGRRIELRHTPELRFYLDESIEAGNRVESILHELSREQGPADAGPAKGHSTDEATAEAAKPPDVAKPDAEKPQ